MAGSPAAGNSFRFAAPDPNSLSTTGRSALDPARRSWLDLIRAHPEPGIERVVTGSQFPAG
jgi:hypothetical protein